MENISVNKKDQILEITINRPQQLNALNKATIAELSAVIRNAGKDADIGVVLITGAGDKSFVAGADINEFAHFDEHQGEDLSAEGHDLLFNDIENLQKPVIAAINGFALGGGLELAMAAHIRIAVTTAKLGLPETSLGLIPGYGGTQRLPQLVGKGKAMELILTGAMITAQEALQIGLVNHVVEPADLMHKANEIAQKILTNSPSALTAAIRTILANYQDGVNGYHIEIDQFGKCFKTNDFKEGTTAFLEKRKPNFRS